MAFGGTERIKAKNTLGSQAGLRLTGNFPGAPYSQAGASQFPHLQNQRMQENRLAQCLAHKTHPC